MASRDTDNLDAKQHADHEKRVVAASSLAVAVALTGMKLIVGIATQSLGILAEAAHSALDLVAAAVTLWAVRVSAQPADRDHTYGHGKVENLSALFETMLLLATCAWIVYEATHRLLSPEDVEVDPSIWAFGVVVISIILDYSRSRALIRVSRKYRSQALEADALHFSTDIWSSSVVLVGLFGVLAAQHYDLPWMVEADTVAALGVAGIVVWVSLKLGKKSVDDLLDRIPQGLQEKVAAAAAGVPGVEEVTQVRMRRAGPEVFADVTLSVGATTSFEKAHQISEQAADAVRSVLPEADVVVHAEPVAKGTLDLTTTVRLLAARHGLDAHGIRLYEEDDRRWLELHVEVSESLSLEEAHRQASEFERDVREKIPGLARVVSHLEPAGDSTAIIQAEPAGESQVRDAIDRYLRKNRVNAHVHNLKVQRAAGGLQISFHCRLDASTPITDAHDFTVRLEDYLRAKISGLGRVVIHVEPAKGAGHDAAAGDAR